ncbi:rho GTPase-activating protein 26-like isoform X2 [Ptychodera flava]|uniref:rho GTPase-activating protein 26-like isoform X2 n=1 Tax=Ptychodera flava TaxID=63121 RepID=UPI003969F6AD
MGLLPLEFSDCHLDSPYFRENLHQHEQELDRTNHAIKQLIKECKALLSAAKGLSKAQRSFAETLKNFNFETIGINQTDDEIVIADSLREFGKLISAIEDERDRMLERAHDQFIVPLETFRKEQIGSAKEGKKKFDKQTEKFCSLLEKHVNLSSKKKETSLQEADTTLETEKKTFHQASLEYVFRLQEVQEKKKFEFVEILLGFMYGWLTFYHQGHELRNEFKPYMTDLQLKLQTTRENFNSTRDETESLMKKMQERPQEGKVPKMYTRQGYLFIFEKRAIGSTWVKHYCMYQKENKIFIVVPYSQVQSKISGSETLHITTCIRRTTDSIDKRFCFDITVSERGGTITLQAATEEDRKLWLEAMDGKEPIYIQPGRTTTTEENLLNDIGVTFIKRCIEAIEGRGLHEQGLYRVVGVNSKVNKLTNMCLDKRKADKVNLDDPGEWEVKTITSALKTYFRNLPEPLMTFKYHEDFITAAKKESRTLRVNDIHEVVHQLPESNFEMLELLMAHLNKVSQHSDKNLMTTPNLGVCFGPTLMRPEEETVAAIMEIKFCNIVVEILINEYDKIFKTPPDGVEYEKSKVLPPSTPPLTSTQSPRSQKPPAPQPPIQIPQTVQQPQAQQQYISLQPMSHQQQQTANVNLRRPNRPRGIYNTGDYSNPENQFTGSSSSSSESISSRSSSTTHSSTSSPPANKKNHSNAVYIGDVSIVQLESSPTLHRQARSNSSNSSNSSGISGPPPARPNNLPISVPSKTSREDRTRLSSSSLSASGTGTPTTPDTPDTFKTTGMCVRTLYACEAENDSELSFQPNQIIYNVHPSKEPGWLEGTLDGKSGLIPENYVEILPT